jgi:hypothetical protein
MALGSCVPVIPSMDLEKSLRLWKDGLEFEVEPLTMVHTEFFLTDDDGFDHCFGVKGDA